IPVADDCLRRQSDQREDGLRRAAFHPEESNRLKYTKVLLSWLAYVWDKRRKCATGWGYP
ncbi:MAG: hypothetical protein R6U98_09720, partial [Pirellulaceae bacterium]